MNKKFIILPFIIIAFIVFFFISGYKLTAKSSVESSLNLHGDENVFGEVKRDWGIVYLLDTHKGIKTALATKKGLLWSCSTSTYFFDDVIKNDLVKTVGWMSIKDANNKQITVFAVQTNDPKVRFIEVGSSSDRQRKPIALNETVIFSWDKSIIWNDLNAIAFDKDNIQLYKYGYPKNVSSINANDLRWYQINIQE